MQKVKLDECINNVNLDATVLNDLIQNIVLEYSKDLDIIMSNINKDILSDDCPAINTIEKYFMELSNHLYFMCETVEKLGVYDSLSKSRAQETYNSKFLEHQRSNVGIAGAKKPTVADSTATAENASIYEKTVNDMYSKAYKIIKNKVTAAETMISTLSKILSHRIQESQLTTSQLSRRMLTEDNITF